MLSAWWLRPKWIKHDVVQVGSVHPSGWNVKLNLQLKRSFFSTSHELSPPKFFRADSIPNVAIKHSTKVQKSKSTPRGLQKREPSPVTHWMRSKNTDALPIKPHIPTLDQDCSIAYWATSHTAPQ